LRFVDELVSEGQGQSPTTDMTQFQTSACINQAMTREPSIDDNRPHIQLIVRNRSGGSATYHGRPQS
jgi:hypothetical protein